MLALQSKLTQRFPIVPLPRGKGGPIQAQRWNIPKEEHSWGGRKEAQLMRPAQIGASWSVVGRGIVPGIVSQSGTAESEAAQPS